MDTLNSDKLNADNDLYLPPTDSFWEIGKYSRVLKRCDDGNKLATDLISMISERADIEKAFSKTLKSWSKKWSEYLSKSSEFGSTMSAWKAIMSEADATADVHQNVHDDILNDVIPAIKSWQKGKYIKSMMHIKSTKEFEEDFKRAQKPWAKIYTKVDKYKREYHVATRSLNTAEVNENNSKLDSSIPAEQRAKLCEKVERCRKEKEAAKNKYAEALQDLNRANPKYMDDMNDVFIRCQSFEKDRLVKFQEFLANTEKCLDISNRLKSPIFQQFSQTIENCDPDKDLSCWSDTFGATMKMNWPIFEEYSESHRTLSRRGKADIERESQVVVTAIRPNNNGPNGTVSATGPRSLNNNVNQSPRPDAHTPVHPSLNTTTTSNMNPFEDSDDDNDTSSKEKATNNGSSYGGGTNNNAYSSLPPYSAHDNHSSYPAAANPFLDDEDNVDSPPSSHRRSYQSPTSAVDSSAGVPVRALYDYEAQEQDELSFKQGEVFTKLEDEDDQGWCKGRVGNRVGLYPATYVEVL